MKRKHIILGAIGGFIVSLCCLGPVLLVLFGLSGVSFALSIGKYTLLFTVLGVLFLSTALFLCLKKKNCNTVDTIKQHWLQILAAFIVMALVLVILKYWLAPYLAQIAYR